MKIALIAFGFIFSNAVFGQMHFSEDQKIDVWHEVGGVSSTWHPSVGDLDDIEFNIRWMPTGKAVITWSNPASASAASTPAHHGAPKAAGVSVSIRVVNLDQGQALLVLDYQRFDPQGRRIEASPYGWKVALQSTPGKLLDPTPENLTPLSVALKSKPLAGAIHRAKAEGRLYGL